MATALESAAGPQAADWLVLDDAALDAFPARVTQADAEWPFPQNSQLVTIGNGRSGVIGIGRR